MKFKIEVQYSLLIFVVTLFWVVFEKQMGWHDVHIADHATFSLIYDFILLTLFAFAFLTQRVAHVEKARSWWSRLGFGIRISLMVTVLSPLVQWLIHEVISPNFFENIINYAVENNYLSTNEAVAKFNLKNYVFENLIGTSIIGFIYSLLLATIIPNQKRKLNVEKQ